jgi:hypothetical protein
MVTESHKNKQSRLLMLLFNFVNLTRTPVGKKFEGGYITVVCISCFKTAERKVEHKHYTYTQLQVHHIMKSCTVLYYPGRHPRAGHVIIATSIVSPMLWQFSQTRGPPGCCGTRRCWYFWLICSASCPYHPLLLTSSHGRTLFKIRQRPTGKNLMVRLFCTHCSRCIMGVYVLQ